MTTANGTRPLDGIRVADFSWFGAGPIAGRTLADFGAEVIRIESEARVDGLRLGQPQKPGKSGYNVCAYFNNFNADKRSFLLNMSAEGSREVALRLIERSDIFLSNLTPRIFERWGLTYEELCEVKPDIIAAYQPMQGLWGPHRDFLGFGAVLTPTTGISHLSGDPERRPVGVGTNYPDYAINPGHTVIAILAALRHRRRTGRGQRIELAQIESVAATMGPALMDYTVNGVNQDRKGNQSSWMCPHGIYRCADDPSGRERWIAIAVRDDAEWESLCAVAEGSSFASDDRFSTLLGRRRHEDELNQSISAWTASFDAASLAIHLQSVGVPAALVQDAEDMCEHDDHLAARGFYAYLDHPETGISLYDGPIVKLHRTPGYLDSPAPLFGEDTFDVATKVLGYKAEEVAELTASGVLS
ncbi:MAG: CoA transferase [Chloroflexi bacterium]|nr:CoA transferase [Chloroflexota bacterium]MYF22773.1 CoA transferase [Chloroflexota bacterium]